MTTLLTKSQLFNAMANAAAKTADAFLTAMDGEEPFHLLRTLPERLRESCVVERQRVEKEVGESTSLSSSPRF